MISSKIIADSISPAGKRIVTFEVEFLRFLLPEVLTHRVFSRNTSSSRAIPVSKMIMHVWETPAAPIHWGKNQPGMQAREELAGWRKTAAQVVWHVSGRLMCGAAWIMSKIGVAKQIANRLIEPWSHTKMIITSTEWDNFFNLRNHPDAQPEIQELARQMLKDFLDSTPRQLKVGEWHIPYVDEEMRASMSLEDALKVSCSLCAQVSYRKLDFSKNKAIKIYNQLIESKPAHASPTEHQATPLDDKDEISGNLRGWKQYRQTIPGNVCNNYFTN